MDWLNSAIYTNSIIKINGTIITAKNSMSFNSSFFFFMCDFIYT